MNSKYLLFTACLMASACTGQTTDAVQQSNVASTEQQQVPAQQIAEYVVETFEDSTGNLWFGGLGEGVAMYNGEVLRYFTVQDGLLDNSVLSMAQDKNGILWFGTDAGLSKYDGKRFTNFTEEDGLCHPRVANLFIDSKDRMWIGTWGGVCYFDGKTFTKFPLPVPDVDLPRSLETQNWVSEIMEDSKGNIWFGRSGYGATKYDPSSKAFTQYTKAEGLPSNCVQGILEDDHGDFWFGMRVAERDNPDPADRNGPGGLARLDGKTFTQFPDQPGLANADVYAIFKDRSGNIWISTTGNGVYRFNGKEFTNYGRKIDTNSNNNTPFAGIQTILEDKNGRIWFGCSGGLFRLDGTGVINVTKYGPWR